MEISITKLKDADYKYSRRVKSWNAYTVDIQNHARILTVVTACDHVTTKWLKQVLKTTTIATPHPLLLVGVSVDSENTILPRYFSKNPLKESPPYGLIQLCIGSHCLIYQNERYLEWPAPKALRDFFSNPKVLAFGVNMVSVAKKLERENGIKFGNVVDLNKLAVEKMTWKERFDLRRYSLDKLGEVVLGQDVYVTRPEKKKTKKKAMKWYGHDCKYDEQQLSVEKVKYAAVDSYLSFMIGFKLTRMKRLSPAEEEALMEEEGRKAKKEIKKLNNKSIMEYRYKRSVDDE